MKNFDNRAHKSATTFFTLKLFIHYKTINLDSITTKSNKDHNEKWPNIPDHPYRILIIGGSGPGKNKHIA